MSTKKILILAALVVGGYLIYTRVLTKPGLVAPVPKTGA